MRRQHMIVQGEAEFSDCGCYRYLLVRDWEEDHKPALGFIMLNPSTADATVDDPTIRRCIGYARAWGYGRLVVGNLFGLRSTDPSELAKAHDPVGPGNDGYLDALVAETAVCIAAWGAHPFAGERANVVRERHGDQLSCLGLTKAGEPRHPLYLRRDAQPIKLT